MSLSISRDLDAAKRAFETKDATASAQAHMSRPHGAEPHSGEAGEYIQAVVFGGLDGITTTFAVVAASAGARMHYVPLLIIAFANLLADAIGMAVGDYLSSQAEDDHDDAERRRERREMETVPEMEKKEMRDIYEKKGLSENEAREVVELLWPYREAFLDVMMVEELEIMPSDQTVVAWKSALVTLFSFLVLGGLPMVPYLLSGKRMHELPPKLLEDQIFWISAAVFIVCLFGLGAWKAYITGKRWWLGGCIMTLTGVVTTGFAVLVGVYLTELTKKLPPDAPAM